MAAQLQVVFTIFNSHFGIGNGRAKEIVAVVVITCSWDVISFGQEIWLQNICWSYHSSYKQIKTTFAEKRLKETRSVPLLGKIQMQVLRGGLRVKGYRRNAKFQKLNREKCPPKSGLAASFQQAVNPRAASTRLCLSRCSSGQGLAHEMESLARLLH